MGKFSMKLVSIITPVYNSQSYLSPCVDSILSQSYGNIELLLIDDGSSDASGSICDSYAKKDTRVKVIHQANSGVSAARNRGLATASGDYILFVDSDDTIHSTMVAELLEKAIDSETVVICSITSHTHELGSCGNFTNTLQHKDAILELLYMKTFDNGPCAKLIPAKLAGSATFNPKIAFAEDLDYIYHVLQRSDRVVFTNKRLYYYRKTPGSAINKPFSEKRMSGLSITENILQGALRNGDKEASKAARFRHFMEAFYILTSIGRPLAGNRKFYDSALKELNRYKWQVATDPLVSNKYTFLALMCLVSPRLSVVVADMLRKQRGHV